MKHSNDNNEDFEYILAESLKNKLKSELDSQLQGRTGKVKQLSFKEKKRTLKQIISIAAVVALIIGLSFYFFKETSSKEMAIAYLDETQVYTYDHSRNVDKGIDNPKSAIVEGSNTASITELFLDGSLSEVNNREKLHISLELMQYENHLLTADSLLRSIQNENSGIKAEKLWLWGLCSILQDDEKSASLHFKELKKISNYKNQEVELLLDRIGN
ncbi:MAG: hypothetical protein MI974_04465 [Chitinophagales bacterium]|nr:hypothetical protein [Chitinophagales bacterium]